MIIQLNKNEYTIIDDEDWEKVKNYAWFADENKWTIYAKAHIKTNDGKNTSCYMHRIILGLDPDMLCDHINHNGLDNRRQNLRIATGSQNNANQRLQTKKINQTSKFKGVSWHHPKNNKVGKWHAYIKKDGKRKYLGLFIDEQNAAEAYDSAALEIFGDFAMTNKKLGLL